MVRAKFLVLAAFVFLASVQGQGSNNSSHRKKLSNGKEKSDMVPGDSTMTLPEGSNESFHKNTLEKSKERFPLDVSSSDIETSKSNTTVAPSTTAAPNTTTVAPITTTSASTTVAPITTPAPPAPTTPLPPVAKGKWAYWDTNNRTCVIVQMAVQFNITYETADHSVNYTVFDLPENTTKVAAGSCGNTTQFITLMWPASSDLPANITNTFTLTFDKNATTSRFSLQKLDAFIVQDAEHFPGSLGGINQTLSLSHEGDQFSTSLGWSYRCVKMQDIVLESKETNSTVAVNDVQFQAFHTEKGTAFGSANDCDYVDVPDIVPIAVGCALGALVLIVLIAYLVGRRRSRAQGYLSM